MDCRHAWIDDVSSKLPSHFAPNIFFPSFPRSAARYHKRTAISLSLPRSVDRMGRLHKRLSAQMECHRTFPSFVLLSLCGTLGLVVRTVCYHKPNISVSRHLNQRISAKSSPALAALSRCDSRLVRLLLGALMLKSSLPPSFPRSVARSD